MKKTDKFKELKELYPNIDEDTVLVAVYGSLRKALGNHHLLGSKAYTPENRKKATTNNNRQYILDQIFSSTSFILSTENTKPEYSMYSLGGFPGVVKGDSSIVIEVYGINKGHEENLMRVLDRLESYRGPQFEDPTKSNSNFYNKITVETSLGEAYMYLYNCVSPPSEESLVSNGDWKNFIDVRNKEYRDKINNLKEAKVED